ncbi:tyrosine-protein kinase STYK1 [Chanos chanos]|uniref:Tyrosine-protein kinase STYK1 n=1 Tax=Chanos chanos TaxID=29144 RepID=A0A6J2UUV6_CHACN|nr:tyrosine-protein kinase STYK1-like [Chanos chanos]
MAVQLQCNNTSNPLCDEEGSGQLAVILIPSLLALSTAMVVSLILWSFLYKRSKCRETTACAQSRTGQEALSFSTVSGTLFPGQEALGSWEIPDHCVLEKVEFLRLGRYGPVCKGLLRRHGISVAVLIKTLRDCSNQQEAKEFVALAHFYATVCKHENLVQILYCQTQRVPMYMVLEAYSPGNLLHFLWSLRNEESGMLNDLQPFSEKSVYFVARQIVSGLDYLLSEHRLIHGNVAARNILIGPGLSVKVSGLDVAFETRQRGKAVKQLAAKVPLKWQAPERIMRRSMTDRSDVWSFGILLYELITLGSPPYPDLEPLDVFPQLQKAYRMKRPPDCGVPLYDLMKYCWMWNFKDRPVFSTVVKLLESYAYLAETKPLRAMDHMDVSEYEKKAGLSPLTSD